MYTRPPLNLLITLFLLCALPATAGELYRWVDAEGRVHFGDRPPTEAKAESVGEQLKPVNGATPISDQNPSQPVSVRQRELNIDREYRERKRVEQARAAQQQQAACAEARRQLQILQGPVYFVDGEGNTSTISERQRQQQAREMEAKVRRICG